MVDWRNMPEYKLAQLCELLEAGDPIPAELARATAAYIQKAIENDGKLPLSRKLGRPSVGSKKLGRACDVAKLVIVDKIKRTEAIKIVAAKNEIKPSTVDQDYKRHGKNAREIVIFWAQRPEWIQLHEELKRLLLTFRNQDGPLLTVNEIDDLAGSIPVLDLKRVVDTINNGHFRRDNNFLEETFCPKKILDI